MSATPKTKTKTKIIKRYANRKLYDTNRSCYATLDDIAHMIRGGDEVQVVDNKTGEDLTQVTLAQIIFEAEKKRSLLSLPFLRGLIQDGGGTLTDLARGGVQRAQTKAQEVRQSAQKLRHDLEGKIDRVIGKPDGAQANFGLAELIDRARRNVDELSQALAVALRGQGKPLAHVASLRGDVEEIQKRLVEVEKQLAQSSKRR